MIDYDELRKQGIHRTGTHTDGYWTFTVNFTNFADVCRVHDLEDARWIVSQFAGEAHPINCERHDHMQVELRDGTTREARHTCRLGDMLVRVHRKELAAQARPLPDHRSRTHAQKGPG